MKNTAELLKERNTQYAEAWRATGPMILPVADALFKLLLKFPEAFYNWVIILNKLCRLLGDPYHLDSWQDIAGYATLVAEYLEKEKEN